jgi:uncharacterized membrane protein (DUF373 family)
MDALQWSQDLVTFAAGATLVLLAAGLLVAAVVDFFSSATHSVSSASTTFLDRVLLVLILVEVVHTVVLSLRTHTLQAEPFTVVGLIAVVRKILLVLAGTATISSTTLAFLVSMLVAFLAGLIALRLIGRRGGQETEAVETETKE